MIKYILVGAYFPKAPDNGKDFLEELIKGFDKPVKILDCVYARPIEAWDELFTEYKEYYLKYIPKENFEMQFADTNKFIEQVQWADVVFLRGGSMEKLRELLRKTPTWLNFMDGKTLVGSSAGAQFISKYYYSLDKLKLDNGFGLLPIKIICHWRSDYNAPNIDWDKALKELKDYKEDLPVYTLAEGEFKVFNE